ncbi:hypothetical protein AURANDRAFT_23262 [Aureococcus anophagefferens]|uniref:Dynein regulatory complex subunit 2 n=1 Tax=Aureococcus anophagefferens TaxID=44056 RepID=F0Y381_AURAN|nr:hypothetical protein AURANDRAFT_23262 [Aureococcus anophagefferens]EGB10296.1 hypothetical protein AURANDRAFT_23262 [Aureococcus anophagefferens]|eukprot:XP_009035105.1 hypothetical protein AURANDRAFT_23262 [Aureococcus anophagefferens]
MRQREYDAQNQKYQAARNELKQRMEQEKANSRMNRLKIQNQWRKIMRLAKVESLRKGIEILSQNHERDVDRKDAIIQMLDRDLEEAEDQFQMALRSHLQNMDQLIDLQDSRLLTSEQEFEQELHTLEAEFQAEKEAIVKQHALETQELNDIMSAVESEEQEREAEAKQEHEQLREEIRNKNLEEINMLRIGLDSQIEDLEQHFETAHLNYLQTTDQRTHDFKYYTKKDQELSKEIEIKIRKIERLQASLHHWRTKLMQNMKECSTRNALLLEEKNKIQGHFQQLKARMNRFRTSQGKRLTELTQNAHACKKKISGRIGLAERILVLSELARKMETEQEKVIPFQANPNNTEADADEAAAALQTSSWTADGKPVQEWCHLDNFLRKYNKVLLDKLAIERERERLEAENGDLQTILKQYFDGVSVNDAVMRSANPLFVVNGKLNISQPLPVRRAPDQLTVVDANHMVTTSRVNTTYF